MAGIGAKHRILSAEEWGELSGLELLWASLHASDCLIRKYYSLKNTSVQYRITIGILSL